MFGDSCALVHVCCDSCMLRRFALQAIFRHLPGEVDTVALRIISESCLERGTPLGREMLERHYRMAAGYVDLSEAAVVKLTPEA